MTSPKTRSEPEALGAAKAAMRREVASRVSRLPRSMRRGAELAVTGHLSALARELGPSYVLGYLALPDEVRIDGFLAGVVERGLTVLLPRVVGDGLCFGEWRPTATLSRDGKGVLAVSAHSIRELPPGSGLILVPGRAFDGAGRRLGRGGGYYDRLLPTLGPACRAVGVGYECQVFESVPCGRGDRPVDYLATETGARRAIQEEEDPGERAG